MSAIDVFTNVHVADFYNISVYWVTEPDDMEYLTECSSDKGRILNNNYLCIGGGSGEHSALVINIDHALNHFLSGSYLDDYLFDDDYHINLNQWQVEDFIEINKKMNEEYESTLSFTDKLLSSVAIFCLFEMPLNVCVKNKDILNAALQCIEDSYTKLEEKVYMYGFRGILKSQLYGKKNVDNKTIWGYSLSDWYNEQK